MTHQNPYASLSAPPAAFAAVQEKATFLKKVYGILLLGVLGFAATLWATANVPFANDLALQFGNAIYGQRHGWAIYLGVFFAGSWLVNRLAEVRTVNAIAFAGWVVLLAFLIAPLVLILSRVNGPQIVTDAAMLTAVTFTGLTAIVFFTGKDFSFLRGILMFSGFALLAVGLVGAIGGYSIGMWYSAAIVVLMGGYVLYDTDTILKRLPTTMAMTGAILLFTDVVLLFKHILVLLSRRD